MQLSIPLNLSPSATVHSSCRARRLRHSTARATKNVATFYESTSSPSSSTTNATTNITSAVGKDADVLAPQRVSATSQWSNDSSNGRHAVGCSTHVAAVMGNPTFSLDQVEQGHGNILASTFPWDPDAQLTDVLQPPQAHSRQDSRAWPFVRAQPTRSIGSMAGFAKKMLRLHGRVLVECSGDEGVFTAIRVLRCARTMLQGEEAHMPAWLPSVHPHPHIPVAMQRTQQHLRSHSVQRVGWHSRQQQQQHLQQQQSQQPQQQPQQQQQRRQQQQQQASLGHSSRARDARRQPRPAAADTAQNRANALAQAGTGGLKRASKRAGQGVRTEVGTTGAQEGAGAVGGGGGGDSGLAAGGLESRAERRPVAIPRGPYKHLLQLVRSGGIPRSLAARQVAAGWPRRTRTVHQYRLHVRKLLAGPIVPSCTLRVPKARSPRCIASSILHHFLPRSHSRDPPRGHSHSLRTQHAKGSSSRKQGMQALAGQGIKHGSPGGVVCLASFGPIAAVNSLKGVALARRRLRMHGRDICVVLEAVGVEIDNAREGSTALHRFMVIECAMGDPTRQLNVTGSAWIKGSPGRMSPGATSLPQ